MTVSGWQRFVRRGLSLEAFKFAAYLLIPVGFVIWYSDPRRVRHYLEKGRFIVYPPSQEWPSAERIREIQEKNNVCTWMACQVLRAVSLVSAVALARSLSPLTQRGTRSAHVRSLLPKSSSNSSSSSSSGACDGLSDASAVYCAPAHQLVRYIHSHTHTHTERELLLAPLM